MWEGPSRPQQPFQRSLSLKKKSLQCLHPRLQPLAGWRLSCLATLTREGTLLPNSSWLSEKQSQCFPHYFLFAATLSPTVTAIWPAVRSRTLGEERGNSVCVWEEMTSLSYVLTCLYSSERNQQHFVCKTTLEIGNIFCVVQGKSRST